MRDRATRPCSRRATALRPGALLVLSLVMVAAAARHVAAGADLEYPVKAEFLERFTHFIRWPSTSFPRVDSPFVVCVIGKNPFGTYLADLIGRRRIQSRRTELRSISETAEIDHCNLLFIASSESRRVATILTYTSGRPILTVGDTEGFASAGVLVNLYIHASNVRFEINVRAVKSSGLKVSSKLLKLARLVAAEPPP